jgi:MinD-like ATPase involved in chromosome partitioning or flagellar assembly
MMGDQADGLRQLFGGPAVTLAVAARETDVIDAYALIKQVAHDEGCSYFRIAITHARTAAEAQNLFDNLQRVAREYLGVRLEYVGMAKPPREQAGIDAPSRFGWAAVRDSVL